MIQSGANHHKDHHKAVLLTGCRRLSQKSGVEGQEEGGGKGEAEGMG